MFVKVYKFLQSYTLLFVAVVVLYFEVRGESPLYVYLSLMFMCAVLLLWEPDEGLKEKEKRKNS